ncbi:MAG: hypothetical protein PHI90_03400 [Clostridia bacterium]|nr:hypothetical protein [Clostridia bacterium]MDD4047862.1 hypothetical protein [Clostridia bacterium]
MCDAKIEQITPGVCPPEGCPPPTRIECIVVDKVYDSCFQLHDVSRDTTVSTATEFTTGTFAVGDIIDCSLTAGASITCTEVSRVDAGGGFFTVTILVSVPVTLINPNDPTQDADRVFTFTKTATLCCPEGVTPDCSESTLIFCSCVVTNVTGGYSPSITVTCTLQVCIVIKCILEVQLLVPSYGFCVPAPCITLPGVCPPTPPAQCF